MADQFKLGDHVLYQGKTYRFPGDVCAITDDGQVVVRAFGAPNGDYAGMKHIFGPSQLVHDARPVSAGEAEASPAPAAMPSEEEIARAVCASDFDGDETVYDTLSSAQRLNFAINARAIAKLFAPILAEKERLSQKVRELALLLDRQMGTPCEQIRHHHAYADLTAIAEKRQDEADQQAARADAAEARALAAEAALAAAREEGAREATERLEGVLARYIDMVGYNEGTDFIDSPGLNGPDEATLYRCSGRDERGEFTDASRANAAAIRAKGE